MYVSKGYLVYHKSLLGAQSSYYTLNTLEKA